MLESLRSLDYLEEANLRAFRSELNSTHYLHATRYPPRSSSFPDRMRIFYFFSFFLQFFFFF